MKAKLIPIEWHPGLPIFAKESYLKSVGDDYGWIGGFSDNGDLRCILPYTVIKKMFFRMVRFRVETLPQQPGFNIAEEKEFLNRSIEYLKTNGADLIIPASNNTIFRTFPDGADAAPYGSYVIDLSQPEDILWRRINRITRQNINTARKNGVCIHNGQEYLDAAYLLIRETFKRSKLPFMKFNSFKRYVEGLGDNGKLMMAEYQGVPQSYVLFAFSNYCAYAVYAGNIANQYQGANKLLYWEAIRFFQKTGVRQYDFMGARIDPKKGSKQDALSRFKKYFGAQLKKGFMWKYSFHPLKYRLYCLAAHLRSGGDIVDAEHHKLKSFMDTGTE
jgi:hypothetical protein